MLDIATLKSRLDGLKCDDDPALLLKRSRDFYWYSPILKKQLDGVRADLMVSPKSEAEVIEVLKACFDLDIPVTTRGGATGNYGQAMPLAGGVLLNMSEMKAIKEIGPGVVIAEAGANMYEIDQTARGHSRQELRIMPSTLRSSTIAGFIAGGSGGVGSIRWGGLRDLGNILRLRIVTMEAEPRVLDLTGWDLHKVSHAYGTNGIITEVEMPLAAAQDWVDLVFGFADFAAAAEFGYHLGHQDGILTKLISPIAAPIPELYFTRHREFLDAGDHVVLVMVAPQSLDATLALADAMRAQVRLRSDRLAAEKLRRLPPLYEFSWNHTTLRALQEEADITYLQVFYPRPDPLGLAERIHDHFGDEVLAHLEVVRFDGEINCFGLPIVRYSDDARLEEIMRIHEDMGAVIFNPHRYTLEEGGMKQTDAIQLAFKREADPKGLLNPGKMIAWDDPDFDFAADKTYLFPGLARFVS